MAAADAASIGEAMRQVEKLTGGLPLLHLAVRSQSIPLVRPPVMSPSQTLLNRTHTVLPTLLLLALVWDLAGQRLPAQALSVGRAS